MSRRKLNLDHITVDSFATTGTPAAARGTVRAHQDTEWETCAGFTCGYVETCGHWPTCYIDCTMDCTMRRC